MIDKNEIKKDLYKSKNMAKFSHYSGGKLFYTIDALGTTYMFPIYVTEETSKTEKTNLQGYVLDVTINGVLQLSADLGETNFGSEIKGSDLNRWIGKAIDADEMINMKPE